MKCSWNSVDLGWLIGGDVASMCKEAIEIATLLDTKVSFVFNEVRVNVSPKSSYILTAQKALVAVSSGVASVYGEGC